MTNRAAAMRYARALLEVSQDGGDPARVEQDLSTFVTLMATHSPLADALTSPAVSTEDKLAVVDALVSKFGGVSEVTRKLFGMLADRDRFSILAEILDSYRERLGEVQGVVQAKITTAIPLPAKRASELAKTLERATGKRVDLETDVDTALVGGIVAQIGSTVYDGSIVNHLERLRRRFLSEA